MTNQARCLMHAIMIVGSILCSAASADTYNLNQNYFNAVARVIGFCIGQDIRIARIAAAYPDEEWPLVRARELFNAGTSNTCETALGFFRNAAGEETFDVVLSEIRGKLEALIANEPVSRQAADELAKEIEARAQWRIEPPILQTMLSLRYKDRPDSELRDGFIQVFESNGHPKAKGVSVRLKVPRSWAAAEGERPNIVQKWTNQNGSGLSNIMLQIRDDLDGPPPTAAEIHEAVANGELSSFVPEGATFRDGGALTLEGLPGFWWEFDQTMVRGTITVFQRYRSHILFLGDKAISIDCSAGDSADQSAVVPLRFHDLLPVCNQVLNGFVALDKY